MGKLQKRKRDQLSDVGPHASVSKKKLQQQGRQTAAQPKDEHTITTKDAGSGLAHVKHQIHQDKFVEDERGTSTGSSKTLGHFSASPVEKDSDNARQPQSSIVNLQTPSSSQTSSTASSISSTSTSDLSSSDLPSPHPEPSFLAAHNPAFPSYITRYTPSHVLKDHLSVGRTLAPDIIIPLRITLTATPTLLDLWDPRRSLECLPATPTSLTDIQSFACLMLRIEKLVRSVGGNMLGALPRSVRVVTFGGLAVLENEKQWRWAVEQAKGMERLVGELRVLVVIGNGRLTGEGQVVEFGPVRGRA